MYGYNVWSVGSGWNWSVTIQSIGLKSHRPLILPLVVPNWYTPQVGGFVGNRLEAEIAAFNSVLELMEK